MTRVRKTLIAVLCIVAAMTMMFVVGCGSNSEQQDTSASADASSVVSEEVSADENMMKTTNACIYIKDGTDTSDIEKVVEEMTRIEGVVTVGYTDEETAKSRAEHALEEIKNEFVPHAFIEYSVSAEFDIDKANAEIAKIEGLSEIRLDNPTVDTASSSSGAKAVDEKDQVSSDSASATSESVSNSSSAASTAE